MGIEQNLLVGLSAHCCAPPDAQRISAPDAVLNQRHRFRHFRRQTLEDIIPVGPVELQGVHTAAEVQYQDAHGRRLAQAPGHSALAMVEDGNVGEHYTVAGLHPQRNFRDLLR